MIDPNISKACTIVKILYAWLLDKSGYLVTLSTILVPPLSFGMFIIVFFANKTLIKFPTQELLFIETKEFKVLLQHEEGFHLCELETGSKRARNAIYPFTAVDEKRG